MAARPDHCQPAAAASYLRRPGDAEYRAVLRVVDGMIAESTTFDAHLFRAFGPPETLAG